MPRPLIRAINEVIENFARGCGGQSVQWQTWPPSIAHLSTRRAAYDIWRLVARLRGVDPGPAPTPGWAVSDEVEGRIVQITATVEERDGGRTLVIAPDAWISVEEERDDAVTRVTHYARTEDCAAHGHTISLYELRTMLEHDRAAFDQRLSAALSSAWAAAPRLELMPMTAEDK